ncbi:MAG: DVUA0089 family protein [Planctomycetota bacterium]
MRIGVCLVASVSLAAGSAAAGTSGTFTVGFASAAGDLGAVGNAVQTGILSGGFVARSLRWNGTLTSAPNAFFFEEDVYASIEGPNGIGYTGPIAGEQGIVLGTTRFSGWSSGFTPASVSGDYRFEAYTPNTFANSTNWRISQGDFAFDEALFPLAESVSVGDTRKDTLSEGEILWYSIDHVGGGLHLSTGGSVITELDGAIQTDDTLIALFDDTGSLVDFNDDANAGVSTSELLFDSLEAGSYRLAVTGATLGTRVGSSFISTSHDGAGSIALSIAVPAPASGVALALAGAFGSRRRRG